MKNLSISLLILLASTAQAKPILCPATFLTHLYDFNSNLRMKEIGKAEGTAAYDHVLEAGYQEIADAIKENPEVVNCVDEIGQTPLSYALNVRVNYCPYLKAARFLLDHGARVNQIEEAQMQTPIFYAVLAYGSIYGTPLFAYQKNEECLKESTETEMRGIVNELLEKGANPDLDTHTVETTRSVAREMKVSFLLKK